MLSVNVYEAKAKLSQLLRDALAGEEVVIAKAGKPLVRLVPVEAPPRAPQLGLDRGRLWIAEDFDTMSSEEIGLWEEGALFPPSTKRSPKGSTSNRQRR